LRPEPTGGDPLRAPAAWEGAEGERATSLAHLVWNAGKQSVIVDWLTDDGRQTLVDLIEASDITICSPGRRRLAELGLDADTFAAGHPDTTLVVLDPFPP